MYPDDDAATLEPVYEDPLELDADIRRDVEMVLMRRCTEAVSDADMRDQDLAAYDDQLNGRGLVDSIDRPAWHHPLTKKAHQQWLANVAQALQIDPLVQVDAINPDDAEEAQALEEAIADGMRTADLRFHLLDAAYLAGRDPAAVMYVGWRQEFRSVRTPVYQDSQTGQMVHPDLRRPHVRHTRHMSTEHERPVYNGYDFQTPDLADVYPYPANVTSLDQALAVFQRVLLSEEDLWNGILDFRYDEDAVRECVRVGPDYDASGNRLRTNQEEYEGVRGAGWRDGFYECFRGYTILPRLTEDTGEPRLPRELIGQEMVVMLYPSAQKCFKLDFCPYDERPWVRWVVSNIPNRLQGEGHCQLLDSLQAMANGLGQNFFDNMELETTPAIAATPDWIQRYGQWKLAPGNYIPRDSPGQWEPVVWSKNSRDIMSELSMVEQQADNLTSAPGYGQLSPKVRRVAEMQSVVGETDAKFGLRLQVFFQALVPVAVKMGAYHYKYKLSRTVTQSELRQRFLFTPVATAQLSTPESRQALSQAKVSLQQQYIMATQALAPPVLKLVWHAIRSSYQALGERRPEDFIGPEPGTPEWQQMFAPPAPPPGMTNGAAVPASMGAPGQPGMPGPPGGPGGPMPGPGGAPNPGMPPGVNPFTTAPPGLVPQMVAPSGAALVGAPPGAS